MRPTLGLVARTIHTSLVDGPGNRFVLFLQGCNLDCVNCHNPQTIDLCDSCGVCLDACAQGALDMVEGAVVFHPGLCDGCDRCIDVCPRDSTPMARWRTVQEVMAELRPVAPFLSGITVSGGEPTLQLEFLIGLFTAVREAPETRRLTTFVDSNGTLPPSGWRRLQPLLSGAMIDLKAGTTATHRLITGQDDGPVRLSIRHLAREGLLHEVRLLVIEGLTDTPVELEAYAAFLRSVDRDVRVRLMAFRHHGVRPRGKRWPETSPRTLESAAAFLDSAGISGVVLPAVA